MSQKIYDMITDRIIALLEAGVVPWRKPWKAGESAPRNLVSRKAYRGINAMLLAHTGFSSPYFLTFNQAKALGGRVKKDEHGFTVIFWKFIDAKKARKEDEDEEHGRNRRGRIPLLRYYHVFNLDQVEGIPEGRIPAKPAAILTDHSPIEEAEAIVEGMPQRPEIRHADRDRACYHPFLDRVTMPFSFLFDHMEDFYNVLFHELCHSTGHPDRLARKSLETHAAFGSEEYSREELVAEMGASFLCAAAGIAPKTIESSAAYIASWLKALKNDRRAVIIAAGQAQKAADFILGAKASENDEEEAAE